MAKREGLEVSVAVGDAAKLADVDVVSAYPITHRLTLWNTWRS